MLFYINYITTCKPLRGSSVFCYGLVRSLIEAEGVCGGDGHRLFVSLSMHLELHTYRFIFYRICLSTLVLSSSGKLSHVPFSASSGFYSRCFNSRAKLGLDSYVTIATFSN